MVSLNSLVIATLALGATVFAAKDYDILFSRYAEVGGNCEGPRMGKEKEISGGHGHCHTFKGPAFYSFWYRVRQDRTMQHIGMSH
jgi:hypothetical protein